MLVTALGIVLPAAALIGVAIDQAPDALPEAQGRRLLERLAGVEAGAVDVGTQVAALGGSAAAWLSRQALGLFGSATRGALNLVISLFGL